MKPIRTLLIANRGEIALRIIATCREMGIRTITLYSTHDAALPHRAAADQSVHLAGETLAETYLNMDAIIAIAKQTGADAIHPGYGFLSENAAFARKVVDAGLIFVGPPADVIAQMGDKITAREAALKAGIPLIPGYNGEKQDAKTLAEEAKKIGFPVIVKASAGGGGKGMRVVTHPEAFDEALAQAKGEAKNAFGDDRVFVEKYITQPRHIEVQVFSDCHGNHIHCFERECSIQRRHQKIIEESPSPALSPALREQICSTALNIASAIGYVGAGTVEFILDIDGAFYFLEMNTRLQVEHPVTEMVTGLDLVRMQIEVAEGKKLSVTQAGLKLRGHAIECRICAEDPDRQFMPATGTIEMVGHPTLRHVRLENGYIAGNAITTHYDPMLAKLIVWGETREIATDKLCQSLQDVVFAGIKTNRSYVQRILLHPCFISGETYTSFVVVHADALAVPPLSNAAQKLAIAAYLCAKPRYEAGAYHAAHHQIESIWLSSALAGFRNVS